MYTTNSEDSVFKSFQGHKFVYISSQAFKHLWGGALVQYQEHLQGGDIIRIIIIVLTTNDAV